MFSNKWVNFFTRVHWSFPMIVVIPIIGWELYLILQLEVSVTHATFFFLLGMLFWTLMEYKFHRYLFHFSNHTPWGERRHFVLHDVHHDYPNDHWRLVMPPVMSSIVIGLSFLVAFFVFGTYLGAAHSGFILGYLLYDTIHFLIYRANWSFSWFKAVKNHHSIHHYKNENNNYGVSSPLWDYIFNTKVKLGSRDE
jgi:sterol desaturase/sphingolipid hydroxylase (fatty acid hydroxylase superfamily)